MAALKRVQNIGKHVLPQRQLLQVCSKQFNRKTGDLRKRMNNTTQENQQAHLRTFQCEVSQMGR